MNGSTVLIVLLTFLNTLLVLALIKALISGNIPVFKAISFIFFWSRLYVCS